MLKKLKYFFPISPRYKPNQVQTRKYNTKMSATIMMPQAFDQALREMCGDAISQAVAALAEKYKFDLEDATRFLEIDSMKLVRKRGPSPKRTEDKPKKATKAKKEKDENKPKRATTGYLNYSKDVRAAVKEELTAALEDDEKLKPQDVVKEIAVRWKALDQEARDEWNEKAKTPATSSADNSDAE